MSATRDQPALPRLQRPGGRRRPGRRCRPCAPVPGADEVPVYGRDAAGRYVLVPDADGWTPTGPWCSAGEMPWPLSTGQAATTGRSGAAHGHQSGHSRRRGRPALSLGGTPRGPLRQLPKWLSGAEPAGARGRLSHGRLSLRRGRRGRRGGPLVCRPLPHRRHAGGPRRALLPGAARPRRGAGGPGGLLGVGLVGLLLASPAGDPAVFRDEGTRFRPVCSRAEGRGGGPAAGPPCWERGAGPWGRLARSHPRKEDPMRHAPTALTALLPSGKHRRPGPELQADPHQPHQAHRLRRDLRQQGRRRRRRHRRRALHPDLGGFDDRLGGKSVSAAPPSSPGTTGSSPSTTTTAP